MRQIVGLIFLLVLVALLVWGVLVMRDFGDPPSRMDDYMIANAQQETGSNNVVAGVLLDYRGLDTLGEVSVLFTAVTAVLLLFRTLTHQEEGG